MSSVRTLRTFIAIAETGSFAAAAQRVALTPAAVGAQMKGFEEEIGRVLFDRATRGAVMTGAGTALLPAARRMVAEFEQMRTAPAGEDALAGTLAVGAIPSAMDLLAGVAVELRSRLPRLEIRLVTGRRPDLADRVATGELDAAIFVKAAARLAQGTEWVALYTEPLVLVCHSEVASSRASPQRLLRTQPFIRFDPGASTGPKVGQILRRSGVRPSQLIEMDSVPGIIELVRKKAGISIVPLQRGCSWAHDPSLAIVPLPGRRLERQIGLLRNLRRPMLTERLRSELLAALQAHSRR